MKQSLSHTVWECKYHVVWVPKRRRKIVYGKLRREVGNILRRLCQLGRLARLARARPGSSARERSQGTKG